MDPLRPFKIAFLLGFRKLLDRSVNFLCQKMIPAPGKQLLSQSGFLLCLSSQLAGGFQRGNAGKKERQKQNAHHQAGKDSGKSGKTHRQKARDGERQKDQAGRSHKDQHPGSGAEAFRLLGSVFIDGRAGKALCLHPVHPFLLPGFRLCFVSFRHFLRCRLHSFFPLLRMFPGPLLQENGLVPFGPCKLLFLHCDQLFLRKLRFLQPDARDSVHSEETHQLLHFILRALLQAGAGKLLRRVHQRTAAVRAHGHPFHIFISAFGTPGHKSPPFRSYSSEST